VNHQLTRQKRKTAKEKDAEYGRKWRRENKEKIKKYLLKNAKRIKLNREKWKKNNPDYGRKWRLKNIEKVRKNDRENKQRLRKDPKYREKENSAGKKWYVKAMKNPEYKKFWNKRNREWAKNHPDIIKENGHNYYKTVTKLRLISEPNFLKRRIENEIRYELRNFQRSKKKRKARKIAALKICHPRGKIQCVKCKEKDIDKLGLDHTRGRKLMGHDEKMMGPKLYTWVINYKKEKGKSPKGLKPMCLSCNWKKEQLRKVRAGRKKVALRNRNRRKRR